MRLAVLGPTVWTTADGSLVVPAPRDRRLLAALAVDRTCIWPVERLAEAMWRDEPPAAAGKQVRNRVSALRVTLGDGVIESVAGGYRLGAQVCLDADATLRAARGDGDPTEALGAWRGRPLVDVEHWSEAEPVIARLVGARAAIEELEVGRALADGRHDEAVLRSEALVVAEPYREPRWLLLVQALHRSGRRRDAMEACRRARRTFAEVGLDPGSALAALEQRVVLDSADDPGVADEREVTGDPFGHATPVRAPADERGDPLIGRADDVTAVIDALGRGSVVTIVELGGVGKTTLARHVAALLTAPPSSRAVVVADLTAAATDADVAAVLARELGLPVPEGADVALALWAARATALVVLDNAEHVLQAVGSLARWVTRHGSGVCVLVTSRVPLGVPGELVLPLAPLAIEDAIELFVRRAPRRPAPESVRRLCTVVDGLPLAVVLAAATADVIEPGELADRLAVGAFSLDGPNAGRTSVDAVVRWSLDALDAPSKDLLGRCAVFRAPFTLEACCAVAGDPASGDPVDVSIPLGSLVRHGLVEVRFGRPTRYRLLELVRASATALADELSIADRARERLVSWATRTVEDARFSDARTLVDDIPNLSAAHESACESGDVAHALRIGGALAPLAHHGRIEPLDWALAALAMPGAAAADRGSRIAGDAIWYLGQIGRTAEARARADRLLQTAPESLGAGWAWHTLAVLAGDRRADEHAVEIACRHDDPLLELGARSTLIGWLASIDPGEAAIHLAAIDRRVGRLGDEAWAQQIASYAHGVALLPTDPDAGLRFMERTQAIADANGYRYVSALARAQRAKFCTAGRDGLTLVRDALADALACAMHFLVPPLSDRAAQLLDAMGMPADAARLRTAAELAVLGGTSSSGPASTLALLDGALAHIPDDVS